LNVGAAARFGDNNRSESNDAETHGLGGGILPLARKQPLPENGDPSLRQVSSPSDRLTRELYAWRPVITPQQLSAAATALRLSSAPPDLAADLSRLVRSTCFNVLDVAIHGGERNLRSAIKKALTEIAATPQAAANVFRLPRLGIMGNVTCAVNSFLLIHLGEPDPPTDARGYFDWVVRAQNLAREVSARMEIDANGRFKKLDHYLFATECINVVDRITGDLFLPQRDSLGPDGVAPGLLLGFTTCAAGIVSEHGLQLINTVRLATNEVSPNSLRLAVVAFKGYSEATPRALDYSLHRWLTEAKNSPRFDCTYLGLAVEFIEEAAKTAAKPSLRDKN